MARVLKGSHSFTCTPRVHPQRNEPYLPLLSQPKLVLIYRPRRNGRLSWPWVAGWFHTEISVRHRELNPDTVTHLRTNRARRRLTSLIEANGTVHCEINVGTIYRGCEWLDGVFRGPVRQLQAPYKIHIKRVCGRGSALDPAAGELTAVPTSTACRVAPNRKER